MAIIEMQRELKLVPDGLWGDGSHSTFLASGRKLTFNWDYLRQKLPTNKTFTQGQVNGLNRLMHACNEAHLRPQHAAYILATAWHETAFRVRPLSEFGRGASRRYGRWLTNSKGVKYCYRNGDRKNPTYYTEDEYPHLFYGRGEPQLTWLDNYIKAGEELGVDFANNPELVNNPVNSANILVKGSMEGWFTSRSIPDEITWGKFDEFVEARSVINGSDRAADIAVYAKVFLTSMVLA